jgi:ribosomal protein L1
MAHLERPVRQSVTLPPGVARRVKVLARTKKTSANRVVVDLIEAGLEARDREKQLFFDLADRLARSSDPAEQRRLKGELARLTFGD